MTMKQLHSALLALPLAFAALPASTIASQAASCIQIEARFIEGAPRDRFILKNASAGNVAIQSASLSLSSSDGKLIFDTLEGGSGVEVFQQFKSESDVVQLVKTPRLADGAEVLSLDFANFNKGAEYRFSLDVDDRLTNSDLGQIRVSGSEMNGAVLNFVVTNPSGKTQNLSATFNKNNRASAMGNCQKA